MSTGLLVLALLALQPVLGWAQAGGPTAPSPTLSPPPSPAPAAQPTAARPRPRVALVLSGGGARGFAHVGVLQVLHELQVPVDLVVGASMGAVVGGAYAAGRTVAELEAFVRATDWRSVIADAPPRVASSLRRKEDDLELPSRIELGLARDGAVLPPAAVGSAAVEDALARLLPPSARRLPSAQQPLPFNAVATDLLTGELVDLSDIPLLPALRATMSVPGVFAPLRLGAQLVVDGGLVRNLPVDLARQMGAQLIIAVNVGTPLAPEGELGSALGVAQQMLNILTEQNVQRSLSELGPEDVLIAPDLRGVSFMDFGAHARAIAAGRAAALAAAPRLRALAVPAARYAEHEAQRVAGLGPAPATDAPRPLVRLEVRGAQHTDAQTLAALSGLETGQPISRDDARRAVERLRGRNEFERVDAQLDDTAEGRELTLTVTEAEWTRSRLRAGLELASDFRDDHRVAVSGLHVLSWLNPLGGELRTAARVGSLTSLATEWYQPLHRRGMVYATAQLGYSSQSQDLYASGLRVARVAVRAQTVEMALGLDFSGRTDLRLGVTRRLGEGEVLLPVTARSTSRFSETNAFVQLRHDTLEAIAFPVAGSLAVLRWEGTEPRLGGRPSLARTAVQGLRAFRLDGLWGLRDWGGHVYAEWSRSPGDFAPLALGGFLRLSGAPRDSINGGKVLFGRAVLARRIGQMPAGFGGAVRAGFSLELGEGFTHDDEVRLARLRPAGSAFVSVDTRFGPAYLALGAAKGGQNGGGPTVYMFLGPVW